MPTLLRSSTPRARKAHRCSSCTGVISVGETYQRDTLKYDDRVYDWLSCEGCEALHLEVWVWADRPDEGVGPEDYEAWADEHLDDPTFGDAARALLDRIRAGSDRS